MRWGIQHLHTISFTCLVGRGRTEFHHQPSQSKLTHAPRLSMRTCPRWPHPGYPKHRASGSRQDITIVVYTFLATGTQVLESVMSSPDMTNSFTRTHVIIMIPLTSDKLTPIKIVFSMRDPFHQVSERSTLKQTIHPGGLAPPHPPPPGKLSSQAIQINTATH
jgi:hypothetical protein